MALDLTTTARVKTLLDISGSGEDSVLAQIITTTSRAAEAFIGRHVEEKARTEYYDIESHQRSVALRGFGEGSTAITSINNDSGWDYASGTDVSSSDYTLDDRTGIVWFNFTLEYGPRALKVVYTGGLGTSVADIITNGYEDLIGAVERQVVFDYKRRADPEVAGVSDPSGNVSFNAQIRWLPTVKDILDSYRVVSVC